MLEYFVRTYGFRYCEYAFHIRAQVERQTHRFSFNSQLQTETFKQEKSIQQKLLQLVETFEKT